MGITMVVVGIHLSTLMSIIATLSTITITTKEIPLTVLITTSIKGISILLAKEAHAHQRHKLVVDQELMLLTGRQQNHQHHQDAPKVEPLLLIEPHHRNPADHQHHNQQDPHHRAHQIDLLHQDHLHHQGLRALVDHAGAGAAVEDAKP